MVNPINDETKGPLVNEDAAVSGLLSMLLEEWEEDPPLECDENETAAVTAQQTLNQLEQAQKLADPTAREEVIALESGEPSTDYLLELHKRVDAAVEAEEDIATPSEELLETLRWLDTVVEPAAVVDDAELAEPSEDLLEKVIALECGELPTDYSLELHQSVDAAVEVEEDFATHSEELLETLRWLDTVVEPAAVVDDAEMAEPGEDLLETLQWLNSVVVQTDDVEEDVEELEPALPNQAPPATTQWLGTVVEALPDITNTPEPMLEDSHPVQPSDGFHFVPLEDEEWEVSYLTGEETPIVAQVEMGERPHTRRILGLEPSIEFQQPAKAGEYDSGLETSVEEAEFDFQSVLRDLLAAEESDEIVEEPDLAMFEPEAEAEAETEAEAEVEAEAAAPEPGLLTVESEPLALHALMALMEQELAASLEAAPAAAKASPRATGAKPASRFVVFQVGGTSFAVPMEFVLETDRMPPATLVPGLPASVCGVVNLRGEILPIVDLNYLLGFGITELTSEMRLLVVKAGPDGQVGLVVERLNGLATLVVDEFLEVPSMLEDKARALLSGMGEHRGQLLSVLNLERVLAATELLELAA